MLIIFLMGFFFFLNLMLLENLIYPYHRNARFIVLEGPDGCGSTTQMYELSRKIFECDKRYSVVMTREPSGGHYGQLIRKILAKQIVVNEPETILALWQADRLDNLRRLVIPALQAGAIILQDRYWYSTVCYQKLQNVDVQKIIQAHSMMIVPHCVLVYDIKAERAKERIKQRGGSLELFEALDIQKRVAENYLHLPELLPEHPFHLIDASQDIEKVAEDTFKVIEPLLPYHNVPMCSAL